MSTPSPVSLRSRLMTIALLALSLVSLTACAGVRFSSDPLLNKNITGPLRERSFLSTGGALQRHLQDKVAGWLIGMRQDGSFERIARALPEGAKVKTNYLDEEGTIFHAKYDHRATYETIGKVPFLEFAASLSEQQAVEVIISDTSEAVAPTPSVEFLARAAYRHDDESKYKELYWVEIAVATELMRRSYVKRETNSTVNGSTFGDGRSVYTSDGSKFQKNYLVTVVTLDARSYLKRYAEELSLDVPELKRSLGQQRVSEVIIDYLATKDAQVLSLYADTGDNSPGTHVLSAKLDRAITTLEKDEVRLKELRQGNTKSGVHIKLEDDGQEKD